MKPFGLLFKAWFNTSKITGKKELSCGVALASPNPATYKKYKALYDYIGDAIVAYNKPENANRHKLANSIIKFQLENEKKENLDG